MKSWSLKKKLTVSFLACGVIPVLIVSQISYNKAKNEITHQANERAHELSLDRERQIVNYVNGEVSSLKDLARVIHQEFLEINSAFEEYKNHPISEDQKASLENYYTEVFSKQYKEKSGNDFDVKTYINSIGTLALSAQHEYLLKSKNINYQNSRYSKIHASYHHSLNSYLESHSLYDVFFVNAKGDVIYSVSKEIDFGTNIVTGPLSNSALAHAFKTTTKIKEGEAHVQDMMPYTPSFESPALFAATPIYESGEHLGSIIIQFPFERINQIVNSREGLGTKGQVLLSGPDLKLRADSFLEPEFTVAKFFAPASKLVFKSSVIERAIETKSTGVLQTKRADGTKIMAFYHPLTFENLTWFMSVELSEDEIFAGLNELFYVLMGLVGFSIVIVGFFSWWMSDRLASAVQAIIAHLSETSKKVASASNESAASATELSEAATEQAASLQETMASVEEISAMVNQNADSAGKAKLAVESNAQSSHEGTKSVEQMMRAIHEIKKTNDDILGQMESSNREFSEIVKIISEIGDKTKVINDIVFQTKLLSFNASVEAARAGEHGKGFAVVAEEVGNLAQMSGNAAKEIGGMLSESIKRVNDIVEQTTAKVDQLVEIGKDKISMGQITAEECQTALQKISESSKTVASMVTEIAHASQEQSQGIQEINKAISQLDQVTQQNSAVSQQSSSQAEHLSLDAKSLEHAVAELVHFVFGVRKRLEHSMGKHSEKSKKVKEQTPSRSSLVSEHVIEIKPHIEKAQKRKTVSEQEKMLRETVVKKAVGSDIVPSSEDPGFEEF